MDLVEVDADGAGRVAVADVVAAVRGRAGRLHHMAASTEVVVEDPEPVRDVPAGRRRMRSSPVSNGNGRRERDRAGHDGQPDADLDFHPRHVTRSTPLMLVACGSQTNL